MSALVNIIVVLPKAEEAVVIKNLLIRGGLRSVTVCTTASAALSRMDDLSDGIVICGYRLKDMPYSQLRDCLPPGFEMLLLASRNVLAGICEREMMVLPMPLKAADLINTVCMIGERIERRRRRTRQQPKVRNEKERALIQEAKELLMVRNNMAEEDAYKYLQKCSMDSGTNMTETAGMVLTLFS